MLGWLYSVPMWPNAFDVEGFVPGVLTTGVDVNLTWRERLGVLVSGRMHVEVQTKTDVQVGKMVARAVAFVVPP